MAKQVGESQCLNLKGPPGPPGWCRYSSRLLSAAVGLLALEMWCPVLAHPAGYGPWCESRAKPGLVLLNNAW